MVFSKRKKKTKLRIGDVNIEQVQKLNDLGSVLTGYGKYDPEIRSTYWRSERRIPETKQSN